MSRRGYHAWLATRTVALCLAVSRFGAAGSVEHALAQLNDGTWLHPNTDHVALSTELPGAGSEASETEAVRLVLVGFTRAPQIRVSTRQANGGSLDSLDALSLVASACPPNDASGPCWSTPRLRLAPDALDRAFVPAHGRSIEAELGGEFQVEAAGRVQGAWRVGAPHSPVFAGLARLGARLRVRILRVVPGGVPTIGGDAGAAVQLARSEVLAASKLWAQCGVDLQGQAGADIQVVDPPPVQLLAVGCDNGLPASGGQVSFRALGRRVRVATHAQESPRIVAQRIATALRGFGLSAQLSPNQRASSGASGAFDVLLRGAPGRAISLSSDLDPHLPLSSDPTLNVCLGEVDLSNGLSHFVEDDAAAGTLEERALIKAFDDGDPSTIEVFIVPSFDQSGRIGESFIDDDGAGIQNTVIIDRAALRAGPRSNALAHELGHVLLDMPGHPDDYDVDQASSLMDSDASDSSVFGPRRLGLADCERMLRESGPGSRAPLLQAWPLAPLPPLEPPAPQKPPRAALATPASVAR
jgi:hypothetical protein